MPVRRRPTRFAFAGWFPKDEIHRSLLVRRDLDPRTGLHLLDRAIGKAAVRGHRSNIEQDVVLPDVGMPLVDKDIDQVPHFDDVFGRTRFNGRLKDTEFGNILVELPFCSQRHFPNSFVQRKVRIVLGRAGVNLVLDVGDVARVGDVFGAVNPAQQPEQNVENNDRSGIADMGVVVDRRTADIHPHIARIERRELRLLSSQRAI